MIQTRYIEVAVTLPVNHTFIYEIPENLDDRCVPGMRVLVPFGRRRVTGYILKRQETSDGYAVKKIVDILDDMPLFPESQIAFFKWISEYYIHPIGEVIKSALPSGLNRHDVACVFPTPKGKRELENETLTHEETNIMQFLESKKSYALKNLTKQVDIPSGLSLVRKMEKRDLLSVSTILKKDQARVQKEKFIIGQKKPVQKIRLSNKRKEILAITSKFSEISLTGLKQKVPTAARLIKPLAEAGYIRIVERSVFRDPLGDPVEPDVPPQLTQEQQQVVERVSQNTQNGFCAYLLSGVTGSGKTEVYMRVVQDVVEKGKSAIVLVPEISLISQTERRFRARFGENVAVIHSSLSKGEVLDQWRKIALNKVAIVVGARSAIFAPFKRPGVIIVDEEHDGSYKQESGLKYNARDLAAVRAKMNQMPVIFGSATPSVQSYYNVVATKFEELKLEERINKHPLPQITPVDLKKYNDVRGIDRIITPELAIQI
ncbi:MAG: primosomal protein N', partial [Desulfobacteraceae bacterium]|nr:primosomal protein N' [Desulfobacteraceae bacterium]